jgi:hypothetical protein
MGDPVNLNRYRKQRERRERERQAERNRTQHGASRADRRTALQEEERRERQLEGVKREPEPDDA